MTTKVQVQDMQAYWQGYCYAMSSMQGWRMNMEDAHYCNENIDGVGTGLFCIFDGHGGCEVAKFCERHFVEVLL